MAHHAFTPPPPALSALPPFHHPLRRPALVAGVGMLLLAVLSGWANFAVIEALVTENDAARTARDILASASVFRLAVGALLVAAVLDVVVAWALRAFFAPTQPRLATMTAWLRTGYAVVFALAAAFLAGALNMLQGGAGATSATEQAGAMDRIESFHRVWDAGLVLFGVHLALVGVLALRAAYVPRLVGWLLLVAGAGYLLDSTTALLAPGAMPEVALVTFVGEVVLLVWLVRGRRAVVIDYPVTSMPRA